MNCNVINTAYKLTFTTDFNGEVEAKIRLNTSGNSGTSVRVREIGYLITDLLEDIQDVGNLRGSFTSDGDYYVYASNVCDIYFEVYYDPIETNFVIRFIGISWNEGVHPYEHLLENKKRVVLKESQLRSIIRETLRRVLLTA